MAETKRNDTSSIKNDMGSIKNDTNGVKNDVNANDQKGNRIQVSNTKKPLSFYLNLAKRHLKMHDDVELSALGMAIPTVVIISEILKRNGVATEKSISISTVATKDVNKGRTVQKARIEIVLIKQNSKNSTNASRKRPGIETFSGTLIFIHLMLIFPNTSPQFLASRGGSCFTIVISESFTPRVSDMRLMDVLDYKQQVLHRSAPDDLSMSAQSYCNPFTVSRKKLPAISCENIGAKLHLRLVKYGGRVGLRDAGKKNGEAAAMVKREQKGLMGMEIGVEKGNKEKKTQMLKT
ncbi:hypothetical protein Sango_2428300 [Sesamum angolense]|uniref:DNA/RNA-binding protein Alba-like domain-containing protein n=1 Tax=Sesamum angolense TaxID=2727404 RepID=A0AAE2BJZ8_9LAMI|nr:hypothetical protein Sango_2428300 [Sesamum angolense]